MGGEREYYCALCPFELTCQRFGKVRDAGDLVGLNKLHFTCILMFVPTNL